MGMDMFLIAPSYILSIYNYISTLVNSYDA